ncbi:MAG: hypothetical protein NT061_12800 [Spirochaetes bacterium]|nr:hypothetical protein [Spirochaetota bacterium]
MKDTALLLALLVIATTAFAQDLKIDYQVNVAADDAANYLTFTGPIRYMAADKDTLVATSGASKAGSTHFFQPYLLDVKGKNVLHNGLRGLFLYAVAHKTQRLDDNLTVSKAANGVITMQYIHRGTAYRLVTDTAGKFTFPKGDYQNRGVGFIQGAGPQVLAADFSADGTPAKADWARIWDPETPDGKEIKAGVATKTGKIKDDNGVAEAMFK